MTNFERVKKFMETFGQEIREKASFPNEKITSLRYDLIKEELDELPMTIPCSGHAWTPIFSTTTTNELQHRLPPWYGA